MSKFLPDWLQQIADTTTEEEARQLDELLEEFRHCMFCGYNFPSRCGKYGCPNCEAESLD